MIPKKYPPKNGHRQDDIRESNKKKGFISLPKCVFWKIQQGFSD